MESMLHKRYKIAERIFSNSLGELCLGRDLQAPANQRCLVHYLPKQLLSDAALKPSLYHLQSLGKQAETIILKVLDCAWSETEVFFVLEIPEAWSLSPLPAIQGQPTQLHQKALAITQKLIDQGLITTGIEPSLFLVTPTGDLYLLGTALLAELQALTAQSPSLLRPIPPLVTRKKPRLLPLVLLGVTGLVAAASLGVYQLTKPNKPIQAPIAPKIQISSLDKPSAHPATTTSLVTTAIQPPPSPTSLAQTALMPTPEPSSFKFPNPSTLSQNTAPSLPQAQPTQATITQAILAKPAIITPPITSNPAASQHLKRASEAIKHGHLQTGLYYLRLAKKLAAHPEHLKTTTQQLLEQAQQTQAANEALSPQMQLSIKQEFGLESFE
ncbi:MAG: hypothetical protein RLZZ215_2351 [Pseudomonadota bacterium]|jgi:hypothetical protein